MSKWYFLFVFFCFCAVKYKRDNITKGGMVQIEYKELETSEEDRYFIS